MAKNDEWCDFCDDKLKDKTVTVKGKEYEICKDCARFSVEQ